MRAGPLWLRMARLMSYDDADTIGIQRFEAFRGLITGLAGRDQGGNYRKSNAGNNAIFAVAKSIDVLKKLKSADHNAIMASILCPIIRLVVTITQAIPAKATPSVITWLSLPYFTKR